MNRFTLFLACLGALFLTGPAFGDNGDLDGTACATVTTDAVVAALTSRGPMRLVSCTILCDDYAAADVGACTEHDFNTGLGIPDVIVLEIERATACSANPVATFTTSPTTAGTTHDISATVNALVEGTVDRIVWDTRTNPPDRFLQTVTSSMTDCTKFSIWMLGYEHQRAR